MKEMVGHLIPEHLDEKLKGLTKRNKVLLVMTDKELQPMPQQGQLGTVLRPVNLALCLSSGADGVNGFLDGQAD